MRGEVGGGSNRSARLSSMTPLADVVGVTCPSALHGAARVAAHAICVEAARCNARRQGFVYALDEWCASPSITPSCEPSGLETSATYTRTDVSLAHHLALHVWGAPVWGAPVWGAPVWGAPVWGAPVWGAPAPAGWQPVGRLVAGRWP